MTNKLILVAITLLLFAYCSAQNVGIGTSAPLSKLDVSGDLALREGSPLAVAAGANTLIMPSAKNSAYRLTGASGAFSITSISAANDGMLLTLINTTGQVMTLTNGSSIQTNTGANLVASGSTASVSLIYNAILGKWVVTAAQGFPAQATTNTLTNTTNTITSTVNGVSATAPAVNTVSSSSTGNTVTTVVNGVTGTAANIINSHLASWTQSGGLTDVVNGVSTNVTPAPGTITNILGYSSTGTPVYQAISGLVHSVSNTTSGNTISTTVDGTTGTPVALPNIYTADGTLAAARTVTMGSDNLTFASTTGNLIFNPSGLGLVGIGTSSPDCLLSNTSTNTIANDGNGISYSSINWAIGLSGYITALYNSSTVGNAEGLSVKIAGTASTNRLLDLSTGTSQSTIGTSVMVVQGNGAVGIGTSSPAATLDVENSQVSQFNIIAHFLAPSNTTAGNITQLRVGVAANTYNSGELRFQYNGNGSISNFVQLGLYGTAGITVNGTGYVGIGTASPTTALQVAGTTTTTNLSVTGTAAIAAWASQSVAASGYASMGGLIVQWGSSSYSSNSPVSVTFPKTYTNVYSVTATVDAGTNSGSGANIPCKVLNISTSSFQYAGTASFSSDGVSKVRWIAIGN